MTYYENSNPRKEGFIPLELRGTRIETKAEVIIDKDGKIYNLKIDKKYYLSEKRKFIGKEIYRLMLIQPLWVPAQKNGIPVKSKQIINIRFDLSFDKEFRDKYFHRNGY